MKKQAKLIVFAIAFASIFFASCNHDLKGTVKGNGIKGGETLTIKVNSDDNIVRFENSTSKSEENGDNTNLEILNGSRCMDSIHLVSF